MPVWLVLYMQNAVIYAEMSTYKIQFMFMVDPASFPEP